MLWERGTGRAVTPVVSWQDQRAGELCAALGRAARGGHDCGRRPASSSTRPFRRRSSPGSSPPTVALRSARRRGELLFGDVAGWLAWHLSGGAAHVTEPSNACRSLLVDLDDLALGRGLLDLFGVPAALLPEIRPSDDPGVHASGAVVGFEAPLAAMLGDQPAALYGQGCTSPRMAALTLGTGAFVWLNVGAGRPEPPPGVLATAAWERRGLRADVRARGLLRQRRQRTGHAPRIGLRGAAGDTPGARLVRPHPVVVPAPAGLGTPHWHGADRVTVLGASSTTTAADLGAGGSRRRRSPDRRRAGGGRRIRLGGRAAGGRGSLRSRGAAAGGRRSFGADARGRRRPGGDRSRHRHAGRGSVPACATTVRRHMRSPAGWLRAWTTRATHGSDLAGRTRSRFMCGRRRDRREP